MADTKKIIEYLNKKQKAAGDYEINLLNDMKEYVIHTSYYEDMAEVLNDDIDDLIWNKGRIFAISEMISDISLADKKKED
jgi:hypothetical protein